MYFTILNSISLKSVRGAHVLLECVDASTSPRVASVDVAEKACV